MDKIFFSSDYGTVLFYKQVFCTLKRKNPSSCESSVRLLFSFDLKELWRQADFSFQVNLKKWESSRSWKLVFE